jgi:prepilin peptidase CpaA
MEQTALLSLTALAVIAACAVVHDLHFRRIPNSIVLAGMTLGLIFQTFAPDGGRLFSGGSGLGFSSALLGGLTGLGLFMPLYLLRVMGAGDVKLLAMIGVWLGPQGVAWTALWTLLAGGVLSIAAALLSGTLRQVLINLHIMFATRSLMSVQGSGDSNRDAAPTATGRLPYALAIATGMVAELVRMRLT